MKIATLLFAAICLTIGLHSCGQTSTQPQVTTTKSMPLHIGNWWKYVREERSKDTSAYALCEIVDYKLIGSHYYYVEKWSVHNDTIWERELAFDTFYRRYDGTRLLSGPILDDTTTVAESELFNEAYTIVPLDSTRRETGYSVLSDSDTVNVPAGTFKHCFYFQTNSKYGTDEQVYTYLAPGVGIVSQFWFKSGIELKEYHIVP